MEPGSRRLEIWYNLNSNSVVNISTEWFRTEWRQCKNHAQFIIIRIHFTGGQMAKIAPPSLPIGSCGLRDVMSFMSVKVLHHLSLSQAFLCSFSLMMTYVVAHCVKNKSDYTKWQQLGVTSVYTNVLLRQLSTTHQNMGHIKNHISATQCYQ